MDSWINRQIRQIDREMDGWIDGGIDGQMDGWMDGWMDGQIDIEGERVEIVYNLMNVNVLLGYKRVSF